LSKIKFLPSWKPIFDSPIFTTPDPFYAGQAWLTQFAQQAEHVPEIHLTINDAIAAEEVNQAVARIVDDGGDPREELTQATEAIMTRMVQN